jgi:hypothetical protein
VLSVNKAKKGVEKGFVKIVCLVGFDKFVRGHVGDREKPFEKAAVLSHVAYPSTQHHYESIVNGDVHYCSTLFPPTTIIYAFCAPLVAREGASPPNLP